MAENAEAVVNVIDHGSPSHVDEEALGRLPLSQQSSASPPTTADSLCPSNLLPISSTSSFYSTIYVPASPDPAKAVSGKRASQPLQHKRLSQLLFSGEDLQDDDFQKHTFKKKKCCKEEEEDNETTKVK